MATADVGKALRALLVAASPVSALIGARVYPSVMPENRTLPNDLAVTYEQTGLVDDDHLQGPAGLAIATMQIQCFGRTYAAVRELANEVDTVLRGYRGTSSGVEIHGIERDNLIELTDLDGDRIERRIVIDYSVWHTEA